MPRRWRVAELATSLGRWARTNRVALVMAMGYTVVVGSISTYRYLTGQTFAWDLGIMQQSLYSAAFHGRFFYYTPELFNKNPSGSFFGVHFSLLLFPLAGFYRLFPSAPALLYLQALVVGLAAVPLVRLCRALRCPHPHLFAGLYLLSPLTVLSNLYDFHLEAFVPLGVFLFLLALIERRPAGTISAAAYLLSVYEYGAIFVVAGVGVYALLRYREIERVVHEAGLGGLLRQRTVALVAVLIATAAVYYVLAFSVIYAVNPTLRQLNGSFSPAALSLSLGHLAVNGGWALLLYFGLPLVLLAFLPFFDPRPLVLIVPFLVPALLSSVAYYTYGYQYGFLIVPGYILAAALGSRRAAATPAARWTGRATRSAMLTGTVAAGVVIVVVASTTAYGSLFGAGALMSDETPWNVAEYRLATLVPAGTSVLVDDNAFPWVANNLQAYVIPLDIEPSPRSYYEAINMTLRLDPRYILLNTLEYGLFPYYQNLSGFVEQNYEPWVEDYGVVLLRWHYAGPMTFDRGYPQTFAAESFPANVPTGNEPYYWSGPDTTTIEGNYSWTVGYVANIATNVTVNVVAFGGAVVLGSSVVSVHPPADGAPASFTVGFRSPYPYDYVELQVLATAGLELSATGGTLVEVGP